MITNKTVGRMNCPICGEEMQDVRLSGKTGGLYLYCDNNCRVWFNKKQNARYIPLLTAGKDVNDGKIFIKSILNGVKQNETKLERTANITRTTGTDGAIFNGKSTGAGAGGAGTGGTRIEPIGRADNGNTGSGNDKPGGFFARLLADDNDE